MRKLIFILFIPFLFWGCDSDDDESRLLSFKLDGVDYISFIPGALLTSNNDGTFDIQVNTVEPNFTFNLFLDDKPLQTVYIDVTFVFVSGNDTWSSQVCNNPLNLEVTFDELNINTTRLNGTFTGRVCGTNVDVPLTDGVMQNIRLF